MLLITDLGLMKEVKIPLYVTFMELILLTGSRNLVSKAECLEYEVVALTINNSNCNNNRLLLLTDHP